MQHFRQHSFESQVFSGSRYRSGRQFRGEGFEVLPTLEELEIHPRAYGSKTVIQVRNRYVNQKRETGVTCNPFISLAGQEGFEPPTPGFGVRSALSVNDLHSFALTNSGVLFFSQDKELTPLSHLHRAHRQHRLLSLLDTNVDTMDNLYGHALYHLFAPF